ncbi:MAG TPA: TraY domain-containing protein [Methylobacterium sp.]|nr:TraY domain-containing protein [Methylobacterium sp.]
MALDLKRKLEDQARENGRSLAQEVERRLAASLDQGFMPEEDSADRILYGAIGRSIKIIQENYNSNWWGNPNVATITEGAFTAITKRLVAPLPGELLYTNRLTKAVGSEDPEEQSRLRSELLDIGMAIGKVATDEAFEARRASAAAGGQSK